MSDPTDRHTPTERPVDRPFEDGQQLCLACGMCCSGDLYVNSWLAPEEVPAARQLGLPIVENARGAPAFSQPCPRHVDDCCTVYEDARKPHVCGSFECKLLQRFLRGEIGLDESLDSIGRARALIADLRDEIGEVAEVSIWTQLTRWDAGTVGTEARIRLRIGALIHLLDKVFLPPEAEADVAAWSPDRANEGRVSGDGQR